MKKLMILTLAGASLALIHTGAAQEASPSPEGQEARGERRGGERRERNPEEFRQRMTERLKESLKVTDEEWTVIQPLVEDVQTKQRAAGAGRFGGRRGGGGPGGERGQGDGVQADAQALRTALESESTSNEEIQAKLNALRDSRKKAAADLAQAREELRKVLTLRQEATLVQMGLLE